MDIALTPEQEAFVRQAIKTGRIERAEDAVTEALLLWEEREMSRTEFAASLDQARSLLRAARDGPSRGDSMQALAEEAKQRLRARLSAEPSSAG